MSDFIFGQPSSSFLSLLSEKEIRVLRKAVRVIHMKHYPEHMLTKREADKIIEAVGPESAAALLEAGYRHDIDNK